MRTDLPACLGNDVLLDQRQEVLIDGAGDKEQRLGRPVMHPRVRRGGLTLTAFLHERLGQSMLAPRVGPHVTVDVQDTQLVRLALRPPLGQRRGELRRLLLTPKLRELAAQRFDLRHAIEPQQNAQLAGLMVAQALDCLDAQQGHHDQA